MENKYISNRQGRFLVATREIKPLEIVLEDETDLLAPSRIEEGKVGGIERGKMTLLKKCSAQRGLKLC